LGVGRKDDDLVLQKIIAAKSKEERKLYYLIHRIDKCRRNLRKAIVPMVMMTIMNWCSEDRQANPVCVSQFSFPLFRSCKGEINLNFPQVTLII
jgi:hypothetical protein